MNHAKTSAYTEWRRSNPDLTTICHQWQLQSPNSCLPHLLRPDGEAASWPLDLVHHLAELSEISSNEHAIVQDELLKVLRLRLKRYPNSAPELIVQDVQTVLARCYFRNSRKAQKMAEDDFQRALPRLDDFPSPMNSKIRKRVETLESGKEKEAQAVPLRTKDQTSGGQRPKITNNEHARTTLPNTGENGTEKQVRFQSPSPSTRPSEATQPPPSSAPVSRTAQEDPYRAVASRHVQLVNSACNLCNEASPPRPLKPLPQGLPALVEQRILIQKQRAEEADVLYFNVLLTKRRVVCDFERTKYELFISDAVN
jgi:hypothetical protein